jgi:hypothetical protein
VLTLILARFIVILEKADLRKTRGVRHILPAEVRNRIAAEDRNAIIRKRTLNARLTVAEIGPIQQHNAGVRDLPCISMGKS